MVRFFLRFFVFLGCSGVWDGVEGVGISVWVYFLLLFVWIYFGRVEGNWGIYRIFIVWIGWRLLWCIFGWICYSFKLGWIDESMLEVY